MIDPLAADPSRLRKLKPRQWQRFDRQLRADDAVRAHRAERDRRRPELVVVTCADCGRELAEVRPGTSVLCRSCRIWTLGPVGDAEVRG